MNRTALKLAAITLPLGACAATDNAERATPPAPPMAECDAAPAQEHIGHTASAAAGAVLLQITGARQLRWVPPRTAMTMDYRAERLTVSYNDDMIIERISCG